MHQLPSRESEGPVSRRFLRRAALIAALGALAVGIGETLLHWTGGQSVAGPVNTPFDFLLGVSRGRLVTGHFLTVLAGPAYYLGYWQVSERLAPTSPAKRRLFFGASLVVLSLAMIWIGSRAYLARSLQLAPDPELQRSLAAEYSLLLESLIWGLRLGMAGLSATFVWFILRGASNYPRWMALASPFFLLLLVFSTAIVPALGNQLIPAALNVAHVPFFLLSALVPFSSPKATHP